MMTIISNIMDGIVFVDQDGNVTLMNPVAEGLLAVKSFAAVGKPLASLQGRAELLRVLVEDGERIGAHKELCRTVEVHHDEQDLLYIKCITTRVHDHCGQTAGLLAVLKDVTAEYKTDQLKNQYLSIVAHELRTPLTGIKTFTSLMVKGRLGPLNERQQRVVESMREQSLRLEQQIDKLINLGHLDSDDYGQDQEPFAIGEFLGILVAPFEQLAKDRRIELRSACAIDAGTLLVADRADLRRACQALVENAVKFTPDGGRVEVRVDPQPDGGARFSVRDTGIGIDPRYHRRIFEKFFQVEDPLTRHHGGAGLGLFVARGIVEAHGSRIEVSSKLGQGADFSFDLPMQVASATALAQVGSRIGPEPQG
jgi:two-component system phosphate regulon sensor histidine kinase PhoR